MEKRIYLDNAATTPVSNEVLQEMLPIFGMVFGNPNSIHKHGRDAQSFIDKARDRIAKGINAKNSNEIYFTSGGTEADNWAVFGIARANKKKGKHLITSQIEHHATLDSFKQLENEGFEVTYLPVDSNGLVSIAELLHAVRKDTTLISIMAVNNEVGTIQNIKTIGKIAHENNAVFHTDAVQALGSLKLDVQDMEIDALSISSHKINGPKGCGALYLKNGIKCQNLIYGGAQERNKRGGTLNTASIVGFGKAVEIANRDLAINQKKIKSLREKFISLLTSKINYVSINGHPYQKVQGIVSVSFDMIEGESILMLLDLAGISVSTASACVSQALEKSHVLKAMGIEDVLSQGTVRFSFSKSNTVQEVEIVVEKLEEIVKKLRAMSPLTKAGRR